MIAASTRIQLPAAQQLGRPGRGRASIVASAAPIHGFGDGTSDSSGAMRLLASRIAQIKGQQQAEKAKTLRPTLPANVLMLDEVAADHRLICKWHENAWSQLKDTLQEQQ